MDFDRAVGFYEAIYVLPAGSMPRMKMGDGHTAMLPCEQSGVGGAIWHDGGMSKPSAEGTRVYLQAAGMLEAVLERVPGAGGGRWCRGRRRSANGDTWR